jgi:ectoine hydroxylase-related dioxygenase (phytanoyl-CoA dioxygenase family)
MMTIPIEFTPEAIAEVSGPDAFKPYDEFLSCRQPVDSIVESNPWMRTPATQDDIVWGEGRYYDTTVARKHEYWKDFDLPTPTKDLRQLRQDLFEWGFCLVEDGLSKSQYTQTRMRLVEQAEAERKLDIGNVGDTFQLVCSLINKGEIFPKFLEHDPAVVQGGPVIEQLLNETLRKGWCVFSFTANISYPGCKPMELHQDQGAINPYQTPEAPVCVTTMYILEDVDERNGTLIVPTSHRLVPAVGSGNRVGKLPPAINVEAPAGTVLLFDGRMLHGTSINRADDWRYVMVQPSMKPWIRTQENFSLSTKPEVLENASGKLLQRLGLQATAGLGNVEGFGNGGTGRAGDARGSLQMARNLLASGNYRHLGELTPADVDTLPEDAFAIQTMRRAVENQ